MTSSQNKRKGYWSIRPIYSLVMLFGSVLCASLGFWQYNKSLTFQSLEHMEVPPITLTGEYLVNQNWYLDNRTLNGKPGYEILTPFISGQQAWLVNRGFVAYERRSELPIISTPKNEIKITAIPDQVVTPLVLSGDHEEAEFSKRIQTINIEHISRQIAHHLPSSLQEHILVLQQGQGQLLPLAITKPYMSKHKHLAYAVQWWLLMVAAVVIWFVSSYKNNKSDS